MQMKLPKLRIGNLVIDKPIVLGGMGIGVSGSRLVAAFANEGGLGILSGVNIGYREPDFISNHFKANLRALKREIRKAKENSFNGIIGVNFMVAMNRYKEYVMAAVEEGIDIIVSGAGLPLDLPEFVKDTKTKIIPIISSAKAANLITKLWDKRYNVIPDALVIEGTEAGGHLGFKMEELDKKRFSLKETLRDVMNVLRPFEEKYNKKVPIILAGGIYSGADIAEHLQAGASAVQMSTRFVATEECDAAPSFKDMYVHAKKEDVEFIISPVGLPGRAIHNSFVEKIKNGIKPKMESCSNCLKTCKPGESAYCISQALINAVKGNVDEGLIFSGSNVYRINKIQTVKEIFQEIVTEAEDLYHA
jgi:nitronate monooxygenase